MNSESAYTHLKRFLYTRFSLHKDKENEADIIDGITRAVEFRGIKVWVLIFAILLASLGLNVNSTAVIIGAMLISPLMGPIMGIGLGLGIFDFELIKTAAKNLAIMVLVSLTASTIYFLLSPLSQAQSELLARTTPTIWDVLIALFGGLAGIVAGASREKGMVIPGVAIATALMPPICTAGYGIAHGNVEFLLGALYLFCINSVFISLSTLFVVRLLRFRKVALPDKRRERKIRNIISAVVIITVLPSIFIAYITVKKELFEQRVNEYIRNEVRFERTYVLEYNTDYTNSQINVFLAGLPVEEDSIEHLVYLKDRYGLSGTNVNFIQGAEAYEEREVQPREDEAFREMYESNMLALARKDSEITALNKNISSLENKYPLQQIADELSAINPDAVSMSLRDAVIFNTEQRRMDTLPTAIVLFRRAPTRAQQQQIADWLKVRINADTLQLVSDEL